MTRLGLAWLALIGVIALCQGCYAHTNTPPGPNCNVDPSNPACYPPLTDQRKPKQEPEPEPAK